MSVLTGSAHEAHGVAVSGITGIELIQQRFREGNFFSIGVQPGESEVASDREMLDAGFFCRSRFCCFDGRPAFDVLSSLETLRIAEVRVHSNWKQLLSWGDPMVRLAVLTVWCPGCGHLVSGAVNADVLKVRVGRGIIELRPMPLVIPEPKLPLEIVSSSAA